MKVAIIGSNGQLGLDLIKVFDEFGYETIGLTHSDLDVTNSENCQTQFSDIKPDVVINCSAYHNVEDCEKNPDTSFDVNGIGPRTLAHLSNLLGFKLVHISTDYVFGGEKNTPYVESDLINPLNVYGVTKASGEFFVQNIADNHLIIRTSGLFGMGQCRAKKGMNFVRLMINLGKEDPNLKVVDSEVVSPTYTEDLAKQIELLVKENVIGLFHATSEGQTSWNNYARTIFELTDIKVNLGIRDPKDFVAKAPRPAYSVLENEALKKAGLNIMPAWEDSLKKYIKELYKEGII